MASELRWVGSGRSHARDARVAAEMAVGGATQGRDAALVLLFASASLDLDTLNGRAYEVSGGAELIGCTSAGEIANGGPSDGGVVALALGGEGFSVATTAVPGLAASPREAGAQAAAAFDGVSDACHHVLLLLTDGLVPQQQQVVRGAHSVLGAGVALVGGGAGDDLRLQATYQFCGGKVVRDSVIAVAIGSDAPLGVGVRHGCTPTGEPMLVTGVSGSVVETLDDRPAMDVYLESSGAPAGVTASRGDFVSFAVRHPLGTVSRAGTGQVRWIPEADFEHRALRTVDAVRPGTLVWGMHTDRAATLSATGAACADALAGLAGASARGIVAFDCAGRRDVLGQDGIQAEVDELERQVGGAPIAGLYTYTEIARTRGLCGAHTETLVVLAIA